VGALGERGGGEELGVAVGAVAGAEEVEEALLGDGDGGWGGRSKIRGFFAALRMTNRSRSGFFAAVRMTIRGGRCGWLGGPCCRVLDGCPGRGLEGLKGDLEGVDELAGAAGVDGVLGETVDDGAEGDEDGGAILDWRQLHAGDLGIDEDAVVFAVGLLDVVVVAIIFAFECGRAATLAGWGLVVVAVVVACEVWQWLRHGVPPWVSIGA
jgi:hypothetical protein